MFLQKTVFWERSALYHAGEFRSRVNLTMGQAAANCGRLRQIAA